MEAELEVKEPHEITLENPTLDLVEPVGDAALVSDAEEKLTHINSSYTLNDTSFQEDLQISMYPSWH